MSTVIRIVKLAISFAYHAADTVLSWFKRLTGVAPQPICTILYYHAVDDRKHFGKQMDIVARCTRPISIDKPELMVSGHRYSAITFDDGMRSVLENALPELEERRMPCTIFMITNAFGCIPNWLKNADYYRETSRVMTKEEMLHVHSDLVTFGSHTVTHPDLTRISGAQMYTELHDSRIELEKLLGCPVRTFSFPHGAYNEAVVALCRKAGYERVFSILPFSTTLDETEYVTGRVWANPEDWNVEIYLKAVGAYRWLPKALMVIQKVTKRDAPKRPQIQGV